LYFCGNEKQNFMGFSPKVKEDIFVASARHCCVCHRYCGVKVEVHHIVPQAQGGDDTFENAIALCFDCHCDAGHYFANHPKGSKFSPTELRKHKNNWFRIVEFNQIPEKEESLIHARYLITQNFEFIKEISNKDLSNFPEDNTLLIETPQLDFIRQLFENQNIRKEEFQKTLYKPEVSQRVPKKYLEEYVEKYPDAKLLVNDDDEYTFFYHYRPPQLDELKSYCKDDRFVNLLLSHGVSPDKLARIFTCIEGECCGEGKLIEQLILRPIFFKYLIITNISESYLQLNELIYKVANNPCFTENEVGQTDNLKLPNVLVKPNQNVVIPLGIFLCNFNRFDDKEYLSGMRKKLSDRQYQTMNHIKLKKEYEVDYIFENYFPLKIHYNINGKNHAQEIHEFDMNNLYWLDRYWGFGSCPHLFFIFDNEKIKYQGEIFNKLPNEISVESFTIKKGINKVVIAELEQEITHIHYIKVNGITIDEDITLIEGQSIEFTVSEYDKVEIKGFYSIESEEFRVMPKHEKQQLIETYKSNYIDSQLASLTVHH